MDTAYGQGQIYASLRDLDLGLSNYCWKLWPLVFLIRCFSVHTYSIYILYSMFLNWLFRRSPLGTSTAGACPNQNPRLCWFVVLVCSLLLTPLIHLYINSSLVLFPAFENLRLVGMRFLFPWIGRVNLVPLSLLYFKMIGKVFFGQHARSYCSLPGPGPGPY